MQILYSLVRFHVAPWTLMTMQPLHDHLSEITTVKGFTSYLFRGKWHLGQTAKLKQLQVISTVKSENVASNIAREKFFADFEVLALISKTFILEMFRPPHI